MSEVRLASAKKVVGARQTLKALKASRVGKVFVACDADQRVVAGILEHCQRENIPVDNSLNLVQLGQACGLTVKVAAAATILK